MINKNQQSGFSLIETLIALTVFSLGFVGVAQFTGEAVKITGNNTTKAIALSVMTQKLTPLFLAADDTKTAFQTALAVYTKTAGEAFSQHGSAYNIKITEAVDDNNGDLISGGIAIANWVSPITVGVTITSDGISSSAPYTFLLTDTVGP